MYLNVPHIIYAMLQHTIIIFSAERSRPKGGGGGVLRISIDGMVEGFFGV